MRYIFLALSVVAFYIGAPFMLIGGGLIYLAKLAEDKAHEIYCRNHT